MSIEFRNLNSLEAQGSFGFPVQHESFSFGYWNHTSNSHRLEVQETYTHYGFICSGRAELTFGNMRFDLHAGMYFCVPGSFSLLGCSEGIFMSAHREKALFQLGGPIESVGRLQYIDGCSDTLLISPPRVGFPCVNLLNIPLNTLQRFHTHPSFRFGMITKGKGFCDSESSTTTLMPGTVFFIPSDGVHRFRTESESLSVIAFHPDSDFGPDDSNHPMINKTIVDGVSAAALTMRERQVPSDSSNLNSTS